MEETIENEIGEDMDADTSKEISYDSDIPEINSDFEILYEGNSLAKIGITGTQNTEYDIRIKVVNGGLPGTASVCISKDKGETWTEETKIPLDGIIKLSGTGPTAEFIVFNFGSVGFVPDDIYYCYVPDPKTELVITQGKNGSAKL